MTYDEVKEMMLLARHVFVDMLDLALDFDEKSMKKDTITIVTSVVTSITVVLVIQHFAQ